MLTQIHVRNFAIIDEVIVEFDQGMNVLTGETGAGKSILVDALGLALGERASADVIRAGEQRAEVTASFAIAPESAIQDWLVEQSVDSDNECHLRRVVNKDGRSKGFINGSPVPIQHLKTIGALLVNIHGQHEHQTLQQTDAQRQMLDARGGLTKPVVAVQKAFDRWQSLTHELDTLKEKRAQRDDRIAYLKFQLEGLQTLDLQAGEVSTLEPERLRLANAEQLATHSSEALDAISDDDQRNAQSLLANAARALSHIAAFDPALGPIVKMIDEAEVNISEAADALRRYHSDIDIDPARQEFVEQRLADIQSLARKHNVEPDALPGKTVSLTEELATLENADAAVDALIAQVEKSRAALDKAAATLSRARLKAAKPFANEVNAGMQQLGMPNGRFEVACEPRESVARHGSDRVQFLVSANPGQPLKPIQKVASGGELSRISLAIQVAAGRKDSVSTMIFDEVDAGVGGAVAEMVGQQMRLLAEQCQVLAVTHLAQVAGQAHHHFKVTKQTDGKATTTGIVALNQKSRVEEIARMLGGQSITDVTRKHAREMLKAAS
ncbi:MAG: DNA repair protein RecN [Woeseiaceae bacterium]